MISIIGDKKPWNYFCLMVWLAAVLFFGAARSGDAATAAQQKSFATAEEATKAAIAAARNNDDKELVAIFGASAKDLVSSGDPVADKQKRAGFVKAFEEKNRLEQQAGATFIVIGKDDWPFPIPLVQQGDRWIFDTAKGREEILNRRIGENELHTIQVMLALVDAQREYAMKDRNGDGLHEYAQVFQSEPGKKNGLFWETKPGEERSPLGAIIIAAEKAGYKGKQQSSGQTVVPYHGYLFKILMAQGKDAPGGAYGYLVKGKLIGGFAFVAYPAKYGNSGVMTFIVNHNGAVFQKDLGKNTSAAVAALHAYNPDKTWTEVKE
jgi:hypothetical protein